VTEDSFESHKSLDAASVKKLPTIEVVEDLTDLSLLLEPYFPSAEDKMQREEAIQLLKQVLASHRAIGNLLFGFLGSYLMKTFLPDSDIDVLIFGSIPSLVFYDLAVAQLRSSSEVDAGAIIESIHFVNSLVPIIEVVVMGINLDVQYCQASELVERYVMHPQAEPVAHCLLLGLSAQHLLHHY
jgi:hypothetical protein